MPRRKKTTYIELPYHEFDDLCNEHLPLKLAGGETWEWNCVADNEWHNDSQHTFDNITGVIEDIDKDEADAILRGVWDMDWPSTPMYRTNLCLELLVRAEVLQPGNYIIDICW